MNEHFEAHVFKHERERFIQRWHVIRCQFMSLFSGNGISYVLGKELRQKLQGAFDNIESAGKQDSKMQCTFTLLTKDESNQFGIHHIALSLSKRFCVKKDKRIDSEAQSPEDKKDFASMFTLLQLPVEPQLDDSGNFI